MSDGNYVLDNTGDLSSLFEGSITNECSAATMPTLMMEPNSGVDYASVNQQDWQDFDGDIDDLLSIHPPTYLRQSKWWKSSRSSARKYEYCYCQCGCAYKLSICITGDVLSGVEQIHYKKVMVSCDVMLLDLLQHLLCYNVLCTSFF
jgi:hypothetical protein